MRSRTSSEKIELMEGRPISSSYSLPRDEDEAIEIEVDEHRS
jgi:hypothetical protein